MARFGISIGFKKNPAVAEAVLDGAVRTLHAAGFSDDEIRMLFVDFAATTSQNDEEQLVVSGTDVDFDDLYPDDRRYEFEDKFEKLESVRALGRLSKRHERQWAFETKESVVDAVEGLREALPLLHTAQVWLLDNAPTANMKIGGLRDVWVETASDGELDAEDTFIFFDDWRYITQYPWDNASSVARYLSGRGELEDLVSLGDLLSQSGAILPQRVIKDVTDAVDCATNFSIYENYVLSLAGRGELMRSQVDDDFNLRHSHGECWPLNMWLDALADKHANVAVFKRSNRWRVEVT